jgi:DNA-binding IclR family transcriptional regulator
LRGAGSQDLRLLAAPVLKRLAAETDETVHLAIRDGHDCIIAGRADTTQVIRVFLEIGTRLPLRATSAGVAIMARLEQSEIDEILRADPPEFANSPMLSAAELRDEIDRTAARGYSAHMSGWFRPHVSSIGAAITDSAQHPIAALVLSIPQLRFDPTREEKLAQLTVAAADEISALISST